MKQLLFLAIVLISCGQESQAQEPFSSGRSISFTKPVISHQHFYTRSQWMRTVTATATFEDGIGRNLFYGDLYHLYDIKKHYPFLDNTYTNVQGYNLRGGLPHGSTSGLGIIGLTWHKNKWLALSVEIGQLNFAGEGRANFYGELNDSIVAVTIHTKEKTSAIINNYQLRVSTPYWFKKRIAFFYEGGISLKYTYDAWLEERIHVNASFSPFNAYLGNTLFGASNNKRALGLDLALFTLGYSLMLSEAVAMEGVMSHRARTALLSTDYSSSDYYYLGLSIRLDLDALVINK